MSRHLLVYVLPAAMLFLCCARSVVAQGVAEPIYRFDPTLNVEGTRRAELTAGRPVVVEKDGERTNLRLQTDGPIAPYVGAERPPELSPEEVRLLADQRDLGKLPDYRLEAGIGLLVEDRASLNLGYRFNERPSLLDERRSDPFSLSGDLRISFDIKVPFD